MPDNLKPSRNGRNNENQQRLDRGLPKQPPLRQELPVFPVEDEEEDEYPNSELTYIAYGENGEDIAFELSESLEEAVEIYESMKEDGFQVKLYQAQELVIVNS